MAKPTQNLPKQPQAAPSGKMAFTQIELARLRTNAYIEGWNAHRKFAEEVAMQAALERPIDAAG